MELLFIKSASGLLPATEEATEWLATKKLGSTVLVEPRGIRNGAFHRKFFALIFFAARVKKAYGGGSYGTVTISPAQALEPRRR